MTLVKASQMALSNLPMLNGLLACEHLSTVAKLFRSLTLLLAAPMLSLKIIARSSVNLPIGSTPDVATWAMPLNYMRLHGGTLGVAHAGGGSMELEFK